MSSCNSGRSLLHGLGLTLLLTGLSAVLAGAIALPLAVFRTNASTAAQLPLRIYISFMRGTPLLGAALPDLLRLWPVSRRCCRT